MDLLNAVDEEVKRECPQQTTSIEIRGFQKRLYFNPGMRKCELHNHCGLVGPFRMLEDHDLSLVPCVKEDCNLIHLHQLLEHISTNHRADPNNTQKQVWPNRTVLKVFWPITEGDSDCVAYNCHCGAGNNHVLFPRFFKWQGYYNIYLKILATDELASELMVDIDVGHRKACLQLRVFARKKDGALSAARVRF